MSNRVVKQRIVKAILEQLPEDKKILFENAMKVWWLNIRNDGGLRLSDVGVRAFIDADIEFFTFPFDPTRVIDLDTSFTTFMLDLNSKLPCPYYIGVESKNKNPYIKIFDSKVAMMINLYGDIHDYLKNAKKRNK
jgi:hypothetical protein